MSDFWTLTNKNEVLNYLEDELEMSDYGYSVVKQDEAAITDVINKVWSDDIEAYIWHAWKDIRTNILDELVSQGYLTYKE